jgi:hypothetical protein
VTDTLTKKQAVQGLQGASMDERKKHQDHVRQQRTIDAGPASTSPVTDLHRLIASAITLLSSAALVTWAAMHSHL